MLRTLLAGIIAIGAWLAWHLLGDLVAEVAQYVLRPVTRPAWRAIVRARSPWPLLLMLCAGLGCALTGLRLLPSSGWRAGAGLVLFLGGAGLALLAPFVWRDAKREAARRTESVSRPVV